MSKPLPTPSYVQDFNPNHSYTLYRPKVTLIRHGESLANVEHELYARHDAAILLTRKGVQQCLDLWETFPAIVGEDPHNKHTTIIASEYQRAFLTAQIVTDGQPYPIKRDARANECLHHLDGTLLENPYDARQRMKSLVQSYPFNLVIFTHGVLMESIDPHRVDENGESWVKNCEVRTYDKEDLLSLCDIKYESDKLFASKKAWK